MNIGTQFQVPEVFYNDKLIEPVLVITGRRRYMGAAFEDGSMPMDSEGNPLPWADVAN